MSALAIRNLAPATELDAKSMSAVRGGTGIGSPSVSVNVPINIAQTNNLMQTTNVLNNSIVGAPGLNLEVNPTQWAANGISLPREMLASLPGHAL